MRFKTKPYETIENREERLRAIHDWFAWYPVRTRDDYWCWLEIVLRQGYKVLSKNKANMTCFIWRFKYYIHDGHYE